MISSLDLAIRNKRKKNRNKQQNNLPRFDRNKYIKAPEVRVITEEGDNLGVLNKEEAISKAQSQDLDLVLVNPQAKPPVAKITSWSKLKYDLKKKTKKQTQKSVETKEMWFKPFIDEGDLDHKMKRVQEFITKKNKVKLITRSRRGATPDQIQETMNKVVERAKEFAELDGELKREGRNLSVFIKPKN